MREFPKGWGSEKIGDLLLVARGGSPRPIKAYLTDDPDGLNWIKISDATAGGARIQSTKQRIRKEGLAKTRAVHPGDFLLSNSMSFGKPYICDIEGCIHDGWLVLGGVEEAFDPDFLYFCLLSEEVQNQFKAKAAGSTVQNLNSDLVRSVEVPVPPIGEQRRIVRKLDTLNARTTTARTHLGAIAKLVERYKNSVLEREFFGPNSGAWAQISFLETVNSTQNGLSKRRGDEGKPSKVLRLADLSGNVFLGDAPREIVLTKNEQEKFALTDGDIVIVRVNGSEKIVGRMIVWGNEEGWTYCDHFIRARLTDQFEPAFVRWLFETDKVRAQIEVSFVSSAGQKTINKSILSQILVPDIPRVDQYKIVQRIETAFYKIDLLAAKAEKALKLTDRLDQRILAKAFAGGLVPQDANDEPASVLLDRIHAERASAPKPKRGRKKKADA